MCVCVVCDCALGPNSGFMDDNFSGPIASSFAFFPRDAMHKRGYCRRAVSVRPSVRLYVRPSVTFVDHVKTDKHIF